MTGRQRDSTFRYIVSRWRIATWFLLLFIFPHHAFAQKDEDAAGDEITILLEVKGIGSTEIPAIIRDNDVYLPVNIIFDFLKIKNAPSVSNDSLGGFYVNQQDIYLVDKVHNRITFKDTITDIKPGDLLKEENSLYLKLNYFKSVFGLDGAFNFRRLAVTLSSAIELPAIREAKQELMRRNMSRLRGDVKADTAVKRPYPAFNLNSADWAVMSTQQSLGVNETRFNLGLGAVLAGGEADASLNYYTKSPVDEKQQYYQWRYVTTNNPVITQVVAGKIFTSSISTLYAPVVGVQVTNAPTTYRKSYGTYTLSNTTDPNWIVELYVNGVLIDYKKTDISGFYTFEVPLIYGYSVIKLRFYGPYGEERTTQQYINIPFNFIPIHEFEYTASGGIVEDGLNSIFSRGGLNYGLSNRVTVGGGMEYLSSVTSGNTMPFLTTSIKLAPRLLLSGEYDYRVRDKVDLSYRLPTSMQIDLDYTKYTPGQTAIYFNYLEERKATFSMPIHTNWLSLFSRFTLDQIVVPNASYTNVEWTFAGTIRRVGLNLSNYASFVHAGSPYLYGLFSATFNLPAKIIFTAQLQYDYKLNQPVFMKYSFEKRLLRNGFFNASYQEFFNNNGIENVSGNYRNVLVGLRYDFSFARVSTSVLADNNNGYSRVESASGSLIYDHKTGYVNANNRTNVGKGEIALEPFLDINCNGIRDPGEPRVAGLKIQMNGGRIQYDDKDTIIRILDLEPYVRYYADLNTNTFDNIAWQIKNHLISIAVSPNAFTRVQIPVAVVGEVSGTVSVNEKNGIGQRGERQIMVDIFDTSRHLAAQTMTESDGFFSYIGLPPGNYNLGIDSVQLHKLHLKPNRGLIPIHIAQSKDGDVADGLEFTLRADTTAVHTPLGEQKNTDSQNGLPVTDTVNKPANTSQKENNTVVDSVTATHTGKIIVKPLPDDNSTKKLTEAKKTKKGVGNAMTGRKYSHDGMSFIELTTQIYKFYSGTVVCVLNDSTDFIDIAQVNPKGEFVLYDFLAFKVAMPDSASGILARAIFVNPKMELIETINMRLVNGRYMLSDKENATLLSTIYFDEMKVGISSNGMAELDKVIIYLKEHPKSRIYLAPRSDAREFKEYNHQFSTERAKSAIDYIVSKGIRRSRITSKGFGNATPADTYGITPTTENENQQNRRVDIYIKN
jgi:outer membrane protein OmpA-like peptidoglycan-associated protein